MWCDISKIKIAPHEWNGVEKSKYSTMSATFKMMGSLAQQHLSSLEEQHHKIKSVAECPKAI